MILGPGGWGSSLSREAETPPLSSPFHWLLWGIPRCSQGSQELRSLQCHLMPSTQCQIFWVERSPYYWHTSTGQGLWGRRSHSTTRLSAGVAKDSWEWPESALSCGGSWQQSLIILYSYNCGQMHALMSLQYAQKNHRFHEVAGFDIHQNGFINAAAAAPFHLLILWLETPVSDLIGFSSSCVTAAHLAAALAGPTSSFRCRLRVMYIVWYTEKQPINSSKVHVPKHSAGGVRPRLSHLPKPLNICETSGIIHSPLHIEVNRKHNQRQWDIHWQNTSYKNYTTIKTTYSLTTYYTTIKRHEVNCLCHCK